MFEKKKMTYVLLGLGGGFLLGSCFQFRAKADKSPYRELGKYSQILDFIEQNFVDEVKSADLVEGSIKGMLETLDPHSAYLEPKFYQQLKSETSGRFGGVGIEVSVKDGLITVVAPIEGSPAHKAGIQAGDKLVKIENKNAKNISLTEAISLMRGKVGTAVRLSFERPGQIKLLNFSLVREQIKVQSIKSARLEGDVGYLRISSFMERTAEDLKKQMEALMNQTDIRGWVLDLRANPGGLLDQAVKVSNFFIDEGPIVYTIGRDRSKRDVEEARRGQKLTDRPVVILVDGASASASEIVAGALQDHKRAIVAGQTTFGKGSVQSVIPVGDESGLKLTIARYYTPSGRSIQAKGIVPDVMIDAIDPKVYEDLQKRSNQGRKEADLERHFEGEGTENSTKGEPSSPNVLSLEQRLKKDYMVNQALGILHTLEIMRAGPVKPVFKWQEEAAASKNN